MNQSCTFITPSVSSGYVWHWVSLTPHLILSRFSFTHTPLFQVLSETTLLTQMRSYTFQLFLLDGNEIRWTANEDWTPTQNYSPESHEPKSHFTHEFEQCLKMCSSPHKLRILLNHLTTFRLFGLSLWSWSFFFLHAKSSNANFFKVSKFAIFTVVSLQFFIVLNWKKKKDFSKVLTNEFLFFIIILIK